MQKLVSNAKRGRRVPRDWLAWWLQQRRRRRVAGDEAGNSPEVQDWLDRIAGAGGAAPSANTIAALEVFLDESVTLSGKLVAVNCIVPDNLIAATVPLIANAGHGVWVNNGMDGPPFEAADLTVDGLTTSSSGDWVYKWLETGVIPGDVFSATSVGMTMYIHEQIGWPHGWTFGARDDDGDGNQMCTFYPRWGGNASIFDCWEQWGAGRTVGTSGGYWGGYFSGNRTAADASTIYEANSFVAHHALASIATTAGAVPVLMDFWLPALHEPYGPGDPSADRFSFVALHDGLSAAESAVLFEAVQNMRISLGGGYV